MTLIEHLRELRARLILVVLGLLVGVIIGFIWYDHGLLAFLKEPYCALPSEYRLEATDGRCTLLVLEPAGALLLRLKVSLLAGVVLSAPWWLYQLWAFVTPGLHKNERRWAIAFVTISTTLFGLGVLCAWLTLNAGLEVLLTLGGDEVTTSLAAAPYLSFVVSLLAAFGVSFEVPLVIVMLNIAGVLTYATLKNSRRWLYFLTFVFAAFITPTQDPFSMLAMALPMVLLFEGAIQVARVRDKRAAKRAKDEYGDITDDEASELDVTPSPLEAPHAVPAPEPVVTPRD